MYQKEKANRGFHNNCIPRASLLLLISVLAIPVASSQSLLGSIAVTGKVRVNGRTVDNGFPIQSESIVETTAKGSSAVVTLDKVGRVEIQEGSEVRIEFGQQKIALAMFDTGKVKLATPAGTFATVRTVEAQIVGDRTKENEYTFDTSCGNIVLSVSVGRVLLRTGGRSPISKIVLAGSTETVGAPNPRLCKQLTEQTRRASMPFASPQLTASVVQDP